MSLACDARLVAALSLPSSLASGNAAPPVVGAEGARAASESGRGVRLGGEYGSLSAVVATRQSPPRISVCEA
jgi:hypothetical protein